MEQNIVLVYPEERVNRFGLEQLIDPGFLVTEALDAELILEIGQDFREDFHKEGSVLSRQEGDDSFASNSPLRARKFEFTGAVLPAKEVNYDFREGYKFHSWMDEENNQEVPNLMAAVSSDILYDVFLSLLDEFEGDGAVDVVLESSHYSEASEPTDYVREHIDLSVLRSLLFEDEIKEQLLYDGETGIAIFMSTGDPFEVRLDEHKNLIIQAIDESKLKRFESKLNSFGLKEDPKILMVHDHDHYHYGLPHSDSAQRFESMKKMFGADGDRDDNNLLMG